MEPVFVEPVANVKARDTTGAGDSFLGALAAHLVVGDALNVAMKCANNVAGVSVTREGTQTSFPGSEEMLARHAIGLIDHTSLGLDDTDEKIRTLVDVAVAETPCTAAVCIYPKFVKLVRSMQKEQPERYPRSLKVCTVVNFPSGQEPTEKVVQDTKAAVQDGADEVDVVINYRLLIENKQEGCKAAEELVKAVRAECPQGQVALKVIIESGELGNEELIVAASEAAIAGGCDFVKTSTGKVKVNATPQAAETMLKVVAASGHAVGFKAAGGVRDAVQARQYMELTARVLLGDAQRHHEVDAKLLRFGASSLLPALRACATSATTAAGVKRKADAAL